jgi:peptidoglycan/xylan/chitin deacetylase (PgdA/CDA1 family)
VSRHVTLTFDNGPTPGITEQVLDVLAERGLPATFFVVGTQVRRAGGRALAERAVAQGHRVGHHTATHTVLLGDAPDPAAAVEAEIAAFAGEVMEICPAEKLFRPYAAGGVLDRRVFSREAITFFQEKGYTCVLWNSVPHDWEDPAGWVDRALADVAGQPWTVVVLHDIDTGAMRALPRFLDTLGDMGASVLAGYPDSCLPIKEGKVQHSLSHLTKETVP